jgi:nucleotide-binding universal stress UspA family protein
MNEIKKILVATDFSTNAEEAVRSGAQLARQYGAELVIAHVLQPPNYLLPEAYLTYSPQFFGETLKGLNKLLADAKKKAQEAGASQVKTELLQGMPWVELTTFAADKQCDMIVVGTHGRTGLSRAFMGSVAEKVVRTASCPVLTVRESTRAAA